MTCPNPLHLKLEGRSSDPNQNKKDAENSGTTKAFSDHLESVVPDSFENNGSENPCSKKFPLLPDIMVEDKSPVDLETCQQDSILESEAGPPGCHFGATDSKTELVSNVEPPIVGNSVAKSSTDFTFPCKKDTSANFGKNTLFVRPQSPEEKAKTLPDYIGGTCMIICSYSDFCFSGHS